MSDSTSTSFLSVLLEYEQVVESVAKRISQMAILLKDDVDDFVVMFNIHFSKDSENENLRNISNDSSISKAHLEIELNRCFSNIQNEDQSIALRRFLNRVRDSWFTYLEDIRKVVIVSQTVQYKLEKLISRGGKGAFNYPRALESIPYILSFSSKFFGIFNVVDDYLTLTTNNVTDKTEENKNDFESLNVLYNFDKKANVFNSPMALDEAKKWFIKLAENNSDNGEPYLTISQVDHFIERAFVGKNELPKLSLNAGKRSKGEVVGLFHEFYTYCTTHHPNTGKIDPAGNTNKYIKLLTDNFDNWTFDEIKHNFRKGGNWKKLA